MEASNSLRPTATQIEEGRERTMNLDDVSETTKHFQREDIIRSDPNADSNDCAFESDNGLEDSENVQEIMIMSDVSEMVKHFRKENVIVWHDPNIHSLENIEHIKELKTTHDVQVFADWKEALEYLKNENQLSSCQLITSGTDGELFVKEIANLPYISSIYVFDNDIDCQKMWVKQHSKIVCIDNNITRLLSKMKKSITKSSLRIDLPSFAPIFDDLDLSEMNYLHFYLKGLVSFTNRYQAKEDFLNLARALYGKNRDIKEFEKSYIKYDMKTILNWYTRECFLHRLTNNCLRLAKSDSILYCRLILKDLETAIKEKYKKQSHKFSGLLYRGTYLSDDEWARLQQNINRDIEMHGFLSTTKKKDIAIGYCQEDMDKKAMITIIVPNFPDKGEQGFAEMREYTEFPGEDEVLFNVRSRFTVLEAAIEEIDGMKIRHLVLLYGRQAMKGYATLQNPSIEVEIHSSETTECKECKQIINIDEERLIGVNICNTNEYFCKDCMQQPDITRKLVLLCVPSSLPEKSKDLIIKIEGIIIPYHSSLDIPFYGEKCAVCKETKLKYCYKCVDCKDTKMIYCNNCFHNKSVNDCLRKGHVAILQGYPFGFWSDKMSAMEVQHMNYQKEQIEKTVHVSQQGNIFNETHNYEKAIEYFQKYLEKYGDLKNEETAVCYNNIGLAHHSSGEYHKALEYHSKCLEIKKEILGDNHPSSATSYNNLGEAYNNLGEYRNAIDCHVKSLEIRKATCGETHPTTATSYNNLGNSEHYLGDYQKSIEYHSKSLEIRKTVFGENHPDTATSYNNLGNAHRSLGGYQKARECYSKSLEINKAIFGHTHPNTAICYNNLADIYNHLGEYQKAIEYYLQALKIRRTVFGDNHPDPAASYNNLGTAYSQLRDYKKATEYYSKSLEIHKAVFGCDHPSTGTCYSNLGTAYENLGKCQKAIKYYSKSLEIRKTAFGDNHPDTAVSYNNLGSAYDSLGDYQKAIDYYSKSLEIYKTVHGEGHPTTGTFYNNLGVAYGNLGNYKKSIECYSKGLVIIKAVLGDNHPNIALTKINMGRVYYLSREYQRAQEHYSEAFRIAKSSLGDQHTLTTTSLHYSLALLLELAYENLFQY